MNDQARGLSTRADKPNNLAHLHRDRGYRRTDRDPDEPRCVAEYFAGQR